MIKFFEVRLQPANRTRIPQLAPGFICFFVAFCQCCHAQPNPQPPQAAAAKAGTNVGESGAFSDVMVRIRPNLLAQIDTLLNSDQKSEAVARIQACLDMRDDKLLLRESKHGISLRAGAAQILREAGEDVWKVYEISQGVEAEKLLELADADGSITIYHEIVRRFAHTTAGAKALDRLANWYFDRRDYDLAVAAWNALFLNPVHAQRITPLQRLKLILAANRSGQGQQFQLLEAASNAESISIGGESREFGDWQTRLNSSIDQYLKRNPENRRDWRLFGGSVERTRIEQGSPPFLRSRLTVPLFDSQSPGVTSPRDRADLTDARSFLDQELSDRQAAGLALGFAGAPLVTRNAIILRDALGVRALSLSDKQTLWTYRTKSAFTVERAATAENETGNLRQSSFLQNSVLCQLSCDEGQVYLVDQMTIPQQDRSQNPVQFDPDPVPRMDGRNTVQPWSRLIALKLSVASTNGSNTNESRIAWSVGGPENDDAKTQLSGHFFLGPPLANGRILYVVSEFQSQYFLSALQPENGNPLWSQALAYVPKSANEAQILIDRVRLAPACFLAGSRGVLVCPLFAGVIVGIDQLTGDFLWTYDYRWRPKSKFTQRFMPLIPHASVEQAIEASYPNPPLIRDGRVYFLAPGDATVTSGDHLHCLDLATGEKRWQTECRDSNYLALLTSDRILAVGGTSVQGISTVDGSVIWSRRVPPVSGIGAVAGETYLLPLSSGRVITLSAKDGSEVGYSLPVDGAQLGNLIVYGNDIISESGSALQIFPQSAQYLADLETKPEAVRHQYASLLELGELYSSLGRTDQAKVVLDQALNRASSDTERSSVRRISRELAWSELIRYPNRRDQLLADFAQACESPEQKAQYLLAKGDEEIRQAKWDAALQTSHELAALNVESILPTLTDPDRQVTPEAWCRALAELRSRDSAQSGDLSVEETKIKELLKSGSINQLRLFLALNPNRPESSHLRLALARKLMDDAQAQASEFAIWEDHLQVDSAGLAACQFLVELWGNAGLHDEAGRVLHRIGTELAETLGPDGRTGHEFYQQFARDSLVWQAARRFVPLDWDVRQAKISEHHEIDRQLRNTFNNWPRSLNFPLSSHQFFLRGQVAPFSLRQINMETGSIVADYSLPTGNRIFYPHQNLDVRQRCGHFLPSAGTTNYFGVSLLDRGVIWQQPMLGAVLPNSMTSIGPASPHSCVYRSRNRLLALDSASGKILWQRTDLEDAPRPQNNLPSIPGDDDYIFVMEADDVKTYHVYNRTDGTLHRTGTLKNCGYIHEHFGRNLLYEIPESPQERRGIRLWDPVTDQTLFEYRLPENSRTLLLSQMSNLIPQIDHDREFAIGEPSGRIRIINGQTGKVKLDIELGDRSVRLNPSLKVFSDGTRYYINVQNGPAGMVTPTLYADASFPTHQIMGDLYAIDPQSSEVIWSRRNMPTQNIVQLAEYKLPFLVSLNRTGGRPRNLNNSLGLRLEVIDGATGNTLGIHANAAHDRLFLMDYDRDLGRLRFRGALTQLQINFGREVNHPLQQDVEYVHLNERRDIGG